MIVSRIELKNASFKNKNAKTDVWQYATRSDKISTEYVEESLGANERERIETVWTRMNNDEIAE